MRRRTKIPPPRPGLISLLLCCAILILISPSTLAANDYASASRNSLDFSLQFSRNELDLKASNSTYPTDQTRISVSIIEPGPGKLDFGLMLGNSYLSLDNDSPSAGLSLNGPHFGLLTRTKLGSNPELSLQAHVLYQRLNDSTSTTDVKVSWYEWQLVSKLRFGLGQNTGLLLGAGYSGVDAERRVTGAINQTLELSLDEQAHGQVELESLFPNAGRISLTVFGGGQQGVSLGFARRF